MNKETKFRPLDYLVLIYCAFNILYALTGVIIHGADSHRMHDPFKHIVIFAGIMIFVYVMQLLDQKYQSPVTRVIRDWYSISLFLYFFEATSALNRIIFPDFIDEFFIKIDRAIFGYDPAIVWGTKYDTWFLNELLHFAYFSYYFMGVFYLWIYLKDRPKFMKYVFQLCFVFFLCYITYNILPVVGGRYFDGMMELAEEYRHGPFTHVMAYIYRMSPHKGGAFPSSHVAIALVVNLSAFNYKRSTGWILLPLVILLAISTVFCHYHYFIDTIFGIIYSLVFFHLSGRLYDRITKQAV